MRNNSAICLLITLLILFPVQSLLALEAGVSRIDITPPLGLNMRGFGPRKAIGVADSLYVRAVVFRSGERSIGFVVHDLGGPLGKAIQDQLRRRINERTGLKELVFSATHTHSGPGVSSGKIDELRDYERIICEKTVDAVVAAHNSLQTVRIGAGFGTVDLNYERHKVYPDGWVDNLWRNHQKIPNGPVDPSVGVIKIDDMQGNPVAVLVNYACHPVIYGRDNLLYSADYPGSLCAQLQKSMQGNPLCIFFTGAAGDMNPYYAAISVEDEEVRAKVDEVGKELADEVAKVAEHIETRPYTDDLSVLHETKYYKTTTRWAEQKDIELPVTTVLITPDIGFVGLPGEPYVRHQQDLRLSSPVDFLFVAGYTGTRGGYLPTIATAVIGGYGANSSGSSAEVGAGEHLVVEALVSLHKLLGELKPVPFGAVQKQVMDKK